MMNKIKKVKKIFLTLGITGAVLQAHAFEPFVIKNIRVNGLQRIEIGSVFSYMPVKSGDTLTDKNADEIIQKLYATGFFNDVRLEEEGNTLIVDVIERPIISELAITGDHAFDHDKLVKALNDNGLMSGKIFDKSVLDESILSLKSEYYNRGLYSVKIDAQVIPLERNRVAVNIAIDEGVNAKIANIEFVGNKSFSQSQLQKLMFLNTGGLFSWWYKDNQYSNDKLSGDIEKIKAFYLNQGYINFKISSIQVQLSPNKKSVYITINMDEGNQYHLDSIKLAGDTKSVKMSELTPLITLKPGQIVNQEQLTKDIENIKNKLGEYGYAFAVVNPIPKIDAKNNTVAYTLFIDTSGKVYIRNINITGNNKTSDTVIRRELRQQEGALYNSAKIKRSKDRLNLLGYFKTTDITTSAVPGTTNQTDMNVKVEENNTGSINFSVGYAQGQGLLLSGGLSQSNIFGSGKAASINASTSLLSQSISLSFTDPYFRPNGTNLGYDVYYNNYTPNAANISPYSTQTLGAKMRTSIPVSEFDRINFAIGLENVQVNLTGNDVPLRFVQFTNQYGNMVNDIPISASWVRNTTDSMLWPTTGAIFSETIDGTAPNFGPSYYRFTSQNTWFFPISKSFTWKTNGQFGAINPYGGSDLVPFYQNYYLGGINTVRGYYLNSLGPRDTDGSSLGGTRELSLSNDLMFPMPGIKDEHTVRMSVFFDAGTLWGGDSFNVTPQQEFRASYGLSLTWISPLGPMKFAYALPLFNQPNDSLEPFQFMLGTSF